MTGPDEQPGRRLPLGGLAVVTAVVVVTAVGTLTSSPRSAQARPTQVEVVGATVVCPDMREKPGVLVSRASVGATPLPPDRAPGPVTGSVLQHAGATPQTSTRLGVAAPGQVSVGVGTTIDKDALVVSASGTLAAGLQAEQVTRGESGRDRGLAGMRCEAPRTEAWFEGGSETVGDETILVLANVDDTPAIVDVTTFSGTGPVDPRPGQGISIPPHTRQVINVDRLAPDRGLLALHVTTRFGRVAAALRYSRLHGSDPDGVEWVPQALPPATRVVVPGVPQVVERGQRFLSLTNPTSDDTTVSVQVTSKTEQFVPTSLASISVPAGTTVVRPLTPLTTDSPVTLTVTSDGAPILAGAYVQDRQNGSPLAEFGFTSGSLPLSGPALLTDLVINRPTESTLILSAPGQAATVMVTPLQVLGTKGPLPKPRVVRIPAGRTVDLRLSTFYKPGTDTKLAVEVRPLPGSGDVYASRYLRERGAHGPLVTLLDLKGPALRVERPAVVQDAQTGG
ncbi:MAG: DUF5719 family protein [Mycobacteriales bacterium]